MTNYEHNVVSSYQNILKDYREGKNYNTFQLSATQKCSISMAVCKLMLLLKLKLNRRSYEQ